MNPRRMRRSSSIFLRHPAHTNRRDRNTKNVTAFVRFIDVVRTLAIHLEGLVNSSMFTFCAPESAARPPCAWHGSKGKRRIGREWCLRQFRNTGCGEGAIRNIRTVSEYVKELALTLSLFQQVRESGRIKTTPAQDDPNDCVSTGYLSLRIISET